MARARYYQHTVLVGDSSSLARLESSGEICENVELVDSLAAALEIRDTFEDVRVIVDPAFLQDSGIAVLSSPPSPEETQCEASDRIAAESEAKFRGLFESMGEAFILCEMIWDDTGAPVDFRYLDINPAWQRHTGIPIAKAIGRTIRQITPNVEQWWIDAAAEVVRTGQPIRDTRYAADLGKWLETYVFKHSENRFASVFVDVTQRKAAEDLLRQSEEMFAKAFRLSPQIMVISDLEDGRYIDVNDAFVEFIGYSREEAIGHTSTELGIWMDTEDRVKFARMLREHGMVRNIETKFRAKSGKILDTLFSADIMDLRGQKCLLAIVNDISERMAVQKALYENRTLLQSIIDNTPAPVYVKDLDGRLIVVNQALADMFGLTKEQMLGMTSYDFYPPEIAEEHTANDRAVFESGVAQEAEEVVSRDEDARTFLSQKFPIRRDDGQIYGIGGISTDITIRKRAEQVLQRNNARLKLVSDAASELLASDNPEETIRHLAEQAMDYLDSQVFLNYLVDESRQGLRLNICLGVPENVGKELDWMDLGTAVRGCVVQRHTNTVVDDVRNCDMPEACIVQRLGVGVYACMPLRSHKDRLMGTFSFGSRTKARFSEDDLSVMRILADNVAIALDRKQAEQELRDGEERLRLATEAGQVGTWSLDLITGAVMWDEYLKSICGLPSDAVVNLEIFKQLVHPDDREHVFHALNRAIECEEPYSDEFRVVRPDGTVRWTSSRGRAVCDESDRPVRLIGAANDTTQRKTAEQELARAREEAERRAGEIESLVTNIPDGLSIFDSNGRLVFMNEEGRKILGLGPRDKFTYWPGPFKALTLDGRPMKSDETATARALRGEATRDHRHRLVYRGREVIISISASPVRDSHGGIIGATNAFRDAAARVEFERQREELLRREHNIASVLQHALIPAEVPVEINGYRVAVKYEPALREAEIGGDFYDVFEMDNGKIGVLIGDVVGKGLNAAIRVAAARYTIKGYAYLDPRPSRVLSLANDSLCKDGSDESGMLTAFLGVLDIASGIMIYSNAGHEPPVIVGRDGTTTELAGGGIPLGVMANFQFRDITRSFGVGEKIVLVTDGITEARTDGAVLFEKSGLLSCLATYYDVSTEELAQKILDTAKDHAGGRLQDDAAIVIVEHKGHPRDS